MKQQLTDEQYAHLQSIGFPFGNTLGELIQFLARKYPSDFNILKFSSGWEVGTQSRADWQMLVKFRGLELIDLLYEATIAVLSKGA